MISVTLLLFALPIVFCGDWSCTSQGGTCKNNRLSCSGFYASGLCSGSWSRQCCLPNSKGISESCLNCICKQESRCRPLNCRRDVNSHSCGYFQIKHGYWIDCGRPGHSWESCAKDYSCAKRCVKKYMARYAWRCTRGRAASCKDFARIHNGGPYGCRRSSTEAYWRAVASQGCSTNS